MFYEKKVFENSPEFLKSEHYQNVSCTVSNVSVKADAQGKKFVVAGTILDADGKAVTITQGGTAEAPTFSFSKDPSGILFDTVEVTHGPQPGAMMIDGSVNTERLQTELAVEAVKELAAKMPFIKFFVDGKLQIKEV